MALAYFLVGMLKFDSTSYINRFDSIERGVVVCEVCNLKDRPAYDDWKARSDAYGS